jgi:hypothetical protein
MRKQMISRVRILLPHTQPFPECTSTWGYGKARMHSTRSRRRFLITLSSVGVAHLRSKTAALGQKGPLETTTEAWKAV